MKKMGKKQVKKKVKKQVNDKVHISGKHKGIKKALVIKSKSANWHFRPLKKY
jgi:hypothetical protein